MGVIRLNRPQARNAFTFPMIREWARILRDAKHDDTVRVIVLTGAGDKAFCSGVDLSSISNANPNLTPLERKSQLHDEIHQIAHALADLDKPVIASINGVAVGAGLDMALMCDLRIMSTTARVSEGYVKVGLTPGDGGAYFLPRIVGTSKALELLLTGDFIDAEEALRIGLVNRLATPETLAEETRALRAVDRRPCAGDGPDDQARDVSVGGRRPAHRAGSDLVALRGGGGHRGCGGGVGGHEGETRTPLHRSMRMPT